MLIHNAIRSNPLARPANPARKTAPAQLRAFRAGDALSQHMQLMGAAIAYPRNAEIYGENEPADYLYKVVSGAVHTYKILSDGRRQIGGFYLPGDIFGLEFAGEHRFSAETIAEARVLVVKRSALTALVGRDAAIGRELHALSAHELQRVQARIMLLIKSAQERVASFLLEMAERNPAGNAIELPMSRRDIADYLGLTIETVSRTLTALESAAAIEVPTSRRIVLRNVSALDRMHG
jgi:CRP/FNR family nitrogen fixation transcriptional regulator